MSKIWRPESRKMVDGKKTVVTYDYVIDGKLKGGIYFDLNDKIWKLDSYGFDKWNGEASTKEEAKELVLMILGSSHGG